MDSYGYKLDQFADGKELVRLAKPLRDHADASCDACGSTQPRTLFCLKDIGAVRYFFVGDNCLRELAKRGVIQRRFGKEATPIAYQLEMERRSQEANSGPSKWSGNNGESSSAPSESSRLPAASASPSSAHPPVQCAEIYVIETIGEYHAFVSVKEADDPRCYWGYAMEARYESTLRRGGEEGLQLDWVESERSHALELSLSKAMEEAYSRFETSRHLPLIDGITDMEELRESTEEPSPQLLKPASNSFI